MRWSKKKKIKAGLHEMKKKSGFLWWPKCIDHEWRWLERAQWRIRFTIANRWVDDCWVNT